MIDILCSSKQNTITCKSLADVNFSQRLSNQAIWAPPSLQLIPWVRKRLFCESSRLRGLLTPLFVTTGTIQTQHINYDFFTFLSKTFTWMSYKWRCKTIISKKRKNTIYKYCFILMIGFWYSSSKYSSGFLLEPDQYLGRQCCRIYVGRGCVLLKGALCVSASLRVDPLKRATCCVSRTQHPVGGVGRGWQHLRILMKQYIN